MSDNNVWSYETLKENLLKRFRLTEGGNRKHFKQSKIENGKTPEQFIDRLRRYLQKWRHMVGFEQTYEGLEDLILRDQFFITCGKPLQTFLKEKGKMTLKKMSQVAANTLMHMGIQLLCTTMQSARKVSRPTRGQTTGLISTVNRSLLDHVVIVG